MKTPSTSILALACTTAFAFTALADTWVDPDTGIEWTYTVSDSKASLNRARPASGALAIPSMLGGCEVGSIGKWAFLNCSGLTSVTIPSSVTSIGEFAFMRCSGLTSMTIPSSVTSIGEGAFCACSALTSVTIPSSVTSIGENLFTSCTELTEILVDPSNQYYSSIDGILYNKSFTTLILCPEHKSDVTIPSSVTSVGGGAFGGCHGLTSVTIPEGVTSIGDGAFCGCSGLTSVTIPEGVTSIGDSAFLCCSAMTSVTIPSSVKRIGVFAFADCSGLTSVTIPSSVTRIGGGVFWGCNSLKTVYVDEADPTRVETLLSKSGFRRSNVEFKVRDSQ